MSPSSFGPEGVTTAGADLIKGLHATSEPWQQVLGQFGTVIRRGQPVLAGPGVALPTSTFPLLSGYVRLTTLEGPLMSLDMLTYAEPYMLPDGYAAGWSLIERQNRLGSRTWTGGAPLAQAIPVTMDVFRVPGLDIDDAWKALRHMARPPGGTRPPSLRIAGPVDHPELQWVIIGLTPDPATTKRHGQKMVRQNTLITLGEWSEPNTKNALKRTTAAKDKPRIIVSLSGDTLKKIARRELNDASRWTEIRKLNKGLHDPDRVIAAHTRISIPAR